ncbi:tail fiber assembly protein [Pseudomonas gingeri]|uniref:tail fiber assembly protein n=1 Tax=Pseudomonas gingeri TaxID=117681 RepID=UPI00210EA8CF|nr:tail fiber assembly protein [Pseudomonas gingeri]
MKFFIDRANGEVFAFESDGSQDSFIRNDLEPLGSDELAAIRAAQEAAGAPTPEQILQAVNARRDELLVVASIRVAPLQDAVDIGCATDDEVSRLALWKTYRVDLNRIEQQTGFPSLVDWPLSPAEAATQ